MCQKIVVECGGKEVHHHHHHESAPSPAPCPAKVTTGASVVAGLINATVLGVIAGPVGAAVGFYAGVSSDAYKKKA